MKEATIRDPGLSVQDIMDRWPETLHVFIRFDMLCIGCTVSPFHSLSKACAEHHLQEDIVRAALDAAISDSGAGTCQ